MVQFKHNAVINIPINLICVSKIPPRTCICEDDGRQRGKVVFVISNPKPEMLHFLFSNQQRIYGNP